MTEDASFDANLIIRTLIPSVVVTPSANPTEKIATLAIYFGKTAGHAPHHRFRMIKGLDLGIAVIILETQAVQTAVPSG